MRNSKPKSAVFERMGCDSAAFARQLCAVAWGNFRNILSRARVSPLLSWLYLNKDNRKIASLAVVISSDTGSDYWQLRLRRKELAGAVRLLHPYKDFLLLHKSQEALNQGTVLATRESFSTKVTQVGIEPGDEV